MSDINIVLENRDDIRVAVEEKDINVEVPAGKDGRSLRPRGEWSASAAYAYLDLVSYEGSSYVATKAVPAGTLPTDTSYWQLTAEKGDPGDPGTPEWGAITGDLSDQTDLQTVLDTKAPVIISSASGSIASFTDGSPAPVTALSVSIEPVQSGTGDPSPDNVRPISGRTSATVTRTGKNLFDKTATNTENGYIDGKWLTQSGKVASDASNAISEYIPIVGNKSYTLTGAVGNNVSLVFYDSNKNIISGERYDGRNPKTVTAPINAEFLRFSITKSLLDTTQLEVGNSATAYQPFVANTKVTIDLDGTRYGGALDVLTGEMVVDRAIVTYVGANDENWTKKETGTASAYRMEIPCDNLKYLGSNKISLYANYLTPILPTSSWGSYYAFISTVSNNIISIGIRSITTVADLKVYLASNPLQVLYYLATPITVTLSPSQLSTLLGTNNIWADTGDVAVEYRADTKLFVQGQIAQTAKVTRQMIADSATADGKAPKSLATGDLIIVGDELRKATANIGNGSAITASNSTIATLADVIKALQ